MNLPSDNSPREKKDHPEDDLLKAEELLFKSKMRPSLCPPVFPDHLRIKLGLLQPVPPPFPNSNRKKPGLLDGIPPPFPKHLIQKQVEKKVQPPPFPSQLLSPKENSKLIPPQTGAAALKIPNKYFPSGSTE